jgi:hypothetical protein
MKDMDTEVAYGVEYRQRGDDAWFVFTNHKYANRVEHGLFDETTDLSEAMAAAHDLMTGKQFTDSRPRYQAKVVQTRVVQRIHMGGILVTLGDPED